MKSTAASSRSEKVTFLLAHSSDALLAAGMAGKYLRVSAGALLTAETAVKSTVVVRSCLALVRWASWAKIRG